MFSSEVTLVAPLAAVMPSLARGPAPARGRLRRGQAARAALPTEIGNGAAALVAAIQSVNEEKAVAGWGWL